MIDRRLVRSLRAILTLVMPGMIVPVAHAGQIGVDQAPREWVAYAAAATARLTTVLTTTKPASDQLGLLIGADDAAESTAATTIKLRIWTDRNGVVTKAGFDRPVDAVAAGAIETGLVGVHLAPPPPLMPQPMTVRVTALPGPASEPAAP